MIREIIRGFIQESGWGWTMDISKAGTTGCEKQSLPVWSPVTHPPVWVQTLGKRLVQRHLGRMQWGGADGPAQPTPPL